MKKEGENTVCVTCPAIQRKAKRIAKQKRKKNGVTKSNKQHIEESGHVDVIVEKDDDTNEMGHISSGGLHVDDNMEENNVSANCQTSHRSQDVRSEMSLNALEEGRHRPLHPLDGMPTDNVLSQNSASFHEQPSSSTIGLNPYVNERIGCNSRNSFSHLDTSPQNEVPFPDSFHSGIIPQHNTIMPSLSSQTGNQIINQFKLNLRQTQAKVK